MACHQDSDVGCVGVPVTLQLWDTAGTEQFQSVATTYYRGAHAVMVVYDIGQKNTFTHMQRWVDDVDTYCGEHVVKMVLGNKADTERREVTSEEGLSFAGEIKSPFLEVSTPGPDMSLK